MMKKKIAVSALIIVMAAGTMAFAFGGRSPEGRRFKAPLHALLSQLPADKEMLFHETMREARDKTADLRGQIADLRADLKEILTGPKFDADRFLAKTQEIQGLHARMRGVMEEVPLADHGPGRKSTVSRRQEQVLLDRFVTELPERQHLALTAVSLLVISVLMIGFAIGFSDPLGEDTVLQEQTTLQEFLYYEGEIL